MSPEKTPEEMRAELRDRVSRLTDAALSDALGYFARECEKCGSLKTRIRTTRWMECHECGHAELVPPIGHPVADGQKTTLRAVRPGTRWLNGG
jgi:DNA-directed RNA polymerase subunit RPC12/RpoP